MGLPSLTYWVLLFNRHKPLYAPLVKTTPAMLSFIKNMWSLNRQGGQQLRSFHWTAVILFALALMSFALPFAARRHDPQIPKADYLIRGYQWVFGGSTEYLRQSRWQSLLRDEDPLELNPFLVSEKGDVNSEPLVQIAFYAAVASLLASLFDFKATKMLAFLLGIAGGGALAVFYRESRPGALHPSTMQQLHAWDDFLIGYWAAMLLLWIAAFMALAALSPLGAPTSFASHVKSENEEKQGSS